MWPRAAMQQDWNLGLLGSKQEPLGIFCVITLGHLPISRAEAGAGHSPSNSEPRQEVDNQPLNKSTILQAFPLAESLLSLFIALFAGLFLVRSPQLLPYCTMLENCSSKMVTNVNHTAWRRGSGNNLLGGGGRRCHTLRPPWSFLSLILSPQTMALVSLPRGGACHTWS